MTGLSCSPDCRIDTIEDIPVITHASDCSYVAGWAWPIPPTHAGPCACRRGPGTEHFTEHTPIGCSVIPSDLADRLIAGEVAILNRPRFLGDDDVELVRSPEDTVEDLRAVSEHEEPIVARQRELYG